MHVQFTEKEGKYIVSGSGSNRFGQYDLSGFFDPSTQEMACTRIYHINRSRHTDPVAPKESRLTRNVLTYAFRLFLVVSAEGQH